MTSDARIMSTRGPKNVVDPLRPYAFLVEPECQPSGLIENVATIFLTNRECPYRCLMCDLWKNTTDETVANGSIAAQIDHALNRLPQAEHIKLYNSGNFFDPHAIPPDDYPSIVQRVASFQSVIVENHPRMISERVVTFQRRLTSANPNARLEIAMGLETIHPVVLPMLNKRMTPDHFRSACQRLKKLGIAIRAFVLLRPPMLSEDEGIDWAKQSIEFAFDCGVTTVSLIPTRGGNGIMEILAAEGHFTPPKLSSLEHVMQWALSLQRGRVFADLWDASRWAESEPDAPSRIAALQQWNLQQRSH